MSFVHPLPLLSFLAGYWLFISRLLWPHSAPQFVNAELVSVLYTSFAVAAIGFPLFRRGKQLPALWLFASAWLLPRLCEATLWNNLLVGLAMAVISVRGETQTFG